MSVSLASPAALWLLWLAIVPLLLARRRWTAPRVVANRYLWRDVAADAADRVAPRRRRVSLVTLLQIFSIGSIVLALAQPSIAGRASRLAIVVDLSASMAAVDGGVSRLDAAIARIRALVDRLPADTHVRLLTVSGTVTDLGDHTAADARLRRAVATLKPTAAHADLAAAVRAAAAAADAVVVVSGAAGADAVASVERADGHVRWIHVGRSAENVAIAQLVVQPAAPGSDGADVLVELRNFGTQPHDAEVALAVDGRQAATRSVHLDAGATQSFTVALPSAGQVVSARLLTPDALAFDNERFAVAPRTGRSRVVLIGAPDSPLGRALAVDKSVSLQVMSTASGAIALDPFDIVACESCTAPPLAGHDALVLFPRGHAVTPAPLTVVAADHPVAASLDVTDARAAAIPGPAVAADDVVVRAGTLPAIVAYQRDGHRVAELRVDLDREDFALTTVFPVIVAESLQWLTRGAAELAAITSGEPIRVAAESADPSRVRVTGPDGRDRAATGAAGELVVFDTGTPGPYRVRSGGRERIVVVNAAIDGESDLSVSARDDGGKSEATTDTLRPEASSLAPVFGLLAAVLAAVEWRARTRSPR